MIVDSRFADALMIPGSFRRGPTFVGRVNSVLDVAEPLLGVDRTKGERAYARRQDGGWLFVTKSPDDTLLYPFDSPLSGQLRYTWIVGEDGIKRGYLKS